MHAILAPLSRPSRPTLHLDEEPNEARRRLHDRPLTALPPTHRRDRHAEAFGQCRLAELEAPAQLSKLVAGHGVALPSVHTVCQPRRGVVRSNGSSQWTALV